MFYDGKKLKILPEEKGYVKVQPPAGAELTGVRLKRLFPLTNSNAFIRMVSPDGKEAGIINNLNELSPESRKNAVNALNHFYNIPKIEEIVDLYDAHGSLFWEVRTDRGMRKFTVKNRYRDISMHPPDKMAIRDTDDNQYEITDCGSLPLKSRKLLEPWL